MTSRSQRILQFVAGRPFPSVFEQIHDAVLAGEPKDKVRSAGSLRAAVSAQLHQLVTAKKLRRTGTPGAYLYHPTRTTLVDLRTHDEEGNPRVRSHTTRHKHAAAKRVPKAAAPAARLVARATPRKTPGTRPDHQKFQIVPPAPPPAPTRRVQPETVEEFLARGGRIQRLADGEVAHPLKHIGAPAPKPTRAKKPTT